MLIDTHAHLDYEEFQPDFGEVIRRAHEAGVGRILTIGTSLESSRHAVQLAERYNEVFAVVGVHPTNLPDDDVDIAAPLLELARHPRVVAIGETGLDYHRLPGTEMRKGITEVMGALGAGNSEEMQAEIADDAMKAAQALRFQQQLDVAVEAGLNVVIHQRDSWADTMELLAPYSGKVRGVFHCFGGTVDQMQQVIAMGHLISFTGIVTFKSAHGVREVARLVPGNSFMVETDCPYLAPEPHRGTRCEPAHTRQVAATIAGVRGTSVEEIARLTTANAEMFFRFPPA